MATPTKITEHKTVRQQNDFGSNYWVHTSATELRRPTAGRGLFTGLQDTKNYNVETGWARRKSGDSQSGILASLWGRITGA